MKVLLFLIQRAFILIPCLYFIHIGSELCSLSGPQDQKEGKENLVKDVLAFMAARHKLHMFLLSRGTLRIFI